MVFQTVTVGPFSGQIHRRAKMFTSKEFLILDIVWGIFYCSGYIARAAEQSLERVFSQHPSEELASFFPIITFSLNGTRKIMCGL